MRTDKKERNQQFNLWAQLENSGCAFFIQTGGQKMSKLFTSIQEMEDFWIQLEQEFFNRVDKVIYKAGINREKQSDEIHLVKLQVGQLMEKRLSRLNDKFSEKEIDHQAVRREFDRAEMSFRRPVNEFITKWMNNGDLWR